MATLKLGKTTKVKREYKVSISKDELEKEVNKLAKEIAPNLKVDGFRKGKIPLEMVKKLRLGSLLQKSVANLVIEEIDKEIKNENLNIATTPHLQMEKPLDEILDVELKVIVELEPEILEMDLKKMEVDLPFLKMTEEEVDAEIKKISSRYATTKKPHDIEYKIANGDVAKINFEGFIDGKPFDGGKAEDYYVEVGLKTLIDTFDEQLIGHKVGDEFDVRVNFPDEYHAENLAGKPVIFKVQITSILCKNLPDLNDDFAKKVGFEDMFKMRDKVQEIIRDLLSSSFYSMVGNSVFTTVLDKNPFDVPESILAEEIQSRLKPKEGVNASLEKKPKDIEKEAKISLMTWYLVRDIAKKQSFKNTEEELRAFLARRLPSYDETGDSIHNFYLSDKKLRSNIEMGALEEKVISFLLSEMSNSKIEMTKEALEKYLDNLKKDVNANFKIAKKGLFG